jgi:hypothetical protein
MVEEYDKVEVYAALFGPVVDLYTDMVAQPQLVDKAEDVVVEEKTAVEQKTVVGVKVEVVIAVAVCQQLVEVVEARRTSSLQSKCKTSNHHLSIPKNNLLDQVDLKHYHQPKQRKSNV